jgi:hypothetical protein
MPAGSVGATAVAILELDGSTRSATGVISSGVAARAVAMRPSGSTIVNDIGRSPRSSVATTVSWRTDASSVGGGAGETAPGDAGSTDVAVGLGIPQPISSAMDIGPAMTHGNWRRRVPLEAGRHVR